MNRIFIRSFFIIIVGVPFCLFLSFLLNIREHSSFKKYYVQTDLYRFLSGSVNYLSRYGLNKKTIGNVHFGKDQYLFYLPKSDGNLWLDLYGTHKIKDNFYNQWKENLERKICLPNYYFVLAPNKERVLVNRLDLPIPPNFKSGTRYYDIFPITKNLVHAEELLDEGDYYVSDTHWNLVGTRKVLKNIFTKSGLETHHLDTIEVTEEIRGGDIAGMINSEFFNFYPTSNKEKSLKLPTLKSVQQSNLSDDAVAFLNNDAPIRKKVLVIGDSFRENLTILSSALFKNTVSVKFKADSYLKTLNPKEFDLVIEVRVERYLNVYPPVTFDKGCQ